MNKVSQFVIILQMSLFALFFCITFYIAQGNNNARNIAAFIPAAIIAICFVSNILAGIIITEKKECAEKLGALLSVSMLMSFMAPFFAFNSLEISFVCLLSYAFTVGLTSAILGNRAAIFDIAAGNLALTFAVSYSIAAELGFAVFLTAASLLGSAIGLAVGAIENKKSATEGILRHI